VARCLPEDELAKLRFPFQLRALIDVMRKLITGQVEHLLKTKIIRRNKKRKQGLPAICDLLFDCCRHTHLSSLCRIQILHGVVDYHIAGNGRRYEQLPLANSSPVFYRALSDNLREAFQPENLSIKLPFPTIHSCLPFLIGPFDQQSVGARKKELPFQAAIFIVKIPGAIGTIALKISLLRGFPDL